MFFAAEKVAKKMPSLPSGYGQYPESQIDNIDRASMIKVPASAYRGR